MHVAKPQADGKMQKYDKIYSKNQDYFGHTSKQFTTMFNNLDFDAGLILDVGAGQGRDAIYLANRGHHVIALDSSAVGLKQLEERIENEKLSIETVHADAIGYHCSHEFDAIVFDRFFHELPSNNRVRVLEKYMGMLKSDGYMLVADDKSVLPQLRDSLKKAGFDIIRDKNGILFSVKP
ncbi:class I SAM-dependent methyltransferase [Pseudovibrio sp. SPO723]|uniref:class I SAM-dependent methyltransferase n=1 Tax=Nesiotobacter zosterae TaxID=392721 RepID=UPI0029C4C882|nr:class I SAM-dependent methyltransferase [Pseudovibrio sp. SPO723]MDX5593636.1 class I SAM-dependent methyltransferase [Pseudovibrio sp. SPO723]